MPQYFAASPAASACSSGVDGRRRTPLGRPVVPDV